MQIGELTERESTLTIMDDGGAIEIEWTPADVATFEFRPTASRHERAR